MQLELSPALASRTKQRPKFFNYGPTTRLGGNEKARIMHAARAYNHMHKKPGEHGGPIGRAALDVLRALLFTFHNNKTGLCFPGYDKIAEAAKVARSTVALAIKTLESVGLLSWVTRLKRVEVDEPTLFGNLPTKRVRVWRTSNSYHFVRINPSKSDFQSGTTSKDLIYSDDGNSRWDHVKASPEFQILGIRSDELRATLERFGRSVGAIL